MSIIISLLVSIIVLIMYNSVKLNKEVWEIKGYLAFIHHHVSKDEGAEGIEAERPTGTFNFCEFVGDDKKDFDEVPKDKRLCKYAGFTTCTLHKEKLKEVEGWRLCCSKCTTPKYVGKLQGAKQ